MCITCFNLVSHDLYRINMISLHLSVLYKMFINVKQRWSSNLGGINFITLKLCSFINWRNAEFAVTTLLTFPFSPPNVMKHIQNAYYHQTQIEIKFVFYYAELAVYLHIGLLSFWSYKISFESKQSPSNFYFYLILVIT